MVSEFLFYASLGNRHGDAEANRMVSAQRFQMNPIRSKSGTSRQFGQPPRQLRCNEEEERICFYVHAKVETTKTKWMESVWSIALATHNDNNNNKNKNNLHFEWGQIFSICQMIISTFHQNNIQTKSKFEIILFAVRSEPSGKSFSHSFRSRLNEWRVPFWGKRTNERAQKRQRTTSILILLDENRN